MFHAERTELQEAHYVLKQHNSKYPCNLNLFCVTVSTISSNKRRK